MPTDNTIFEDTTHDNGTGDVVNSDENPVLTKQPKEHYDVFLNYKLAYQPNGERALRVWANGQYIDITAAQAQQLSILLLPAANDLADIRQGIGGES